MAIFSGKIIEASYTNEAKDTVEIVYKEGTKAVVYYLQINHSHPDTIDLIKEYSLDKSKELGFTEGDPVLDTFKDWAKQNNISQTAFDEIVTKIGDMGVEQQEQEKIHIKEEKEKLGENADNIVNSNIKWGRGLVSKGILSEQDYSELEIWGGTASGQRLLNKFRGLMGEREIPTVNVSDGGLAKDEVLSRVADPRYKDDIAFRKQVERDLEELERAGKL